ncbi:hypothetical protein Bbelb_076580 [Branchiostoma belcheri]|nr:hypothetical protein Bbelb_076580 [Branchiostoma belcheri]
MVLFLDLPPVPVAAAEIDDVVPGWKWIPAEGTRHLDTSRRCDVPLGKSSFPCRLDSPRPISDLQDSIDLLVNPEGERSPGAAPINNGEPRAFVPHSASRTDPATCASEIRPVWGRAAVPVRSPSVGSKSSRGYRNDSLRVGCA